MFSIPYCMSVGIRVLLAIVFGISEFPLSGNSIPANETCVNVTAEIICYFKGSEKPVGWHKARKLCKSFNSTLPVIRNEHDQNAVAGYLKSQLSTSITWTAGKNFTYSTWTWINGEPLKESVQVKLQENEEQAGETVYAAFDGDSGFIAHAASNEFPYICQYMGAYCNFSNDINMTNNCLRFTNDNRTWYDARNQCLMTGEDLAVIDIEAPIFDKQLKLKQRYWIGLREKSWRWRGNYMAESSDEIKYTNWDINGFSRDGECISIGTSDGKWKALGCGVANEVVCQKVQGLTPTMTPETSDEIIPTKVESFLFILCAAVGAGIIIIACIVIIIVFTLKIRKRPVKEIGHSRLDNNSSQNNLQELDGRITNAPVYASVSEPNNAPVKSSDDVRDVSAEIPLLSTLDESEDGATNQVSGIVWSSLEIKEDPKSHTAKNPDEGFYANLEAEILDKEQAAEEHVHTK